LLLAAHQVSGALKLYKIGFSWNQPDPKDQQSQPGVPPQLTVTSLLEEASCFPVDLSTGHQGEDGASNVDSSLSYQLSYLELLPQAPEQGSKEPSERTVMAIFTVTPSPAAMLDPMQQYQQVSSTICRWELKTGLADKLASSFDLLSVKKKVANAVPSRVSDMCYYVASYVDTMTAPRPPSKTCRHITSSCCIKCCVGQESYYVCIHNERWLDPIQI